MTPSSQRAIISSAMLAMDNIDVRFVAVALPLEEKDNKENLPVNSVKRYFLAWREEGCFRILITGH